MPDLALAHSRDSRDEGCPPSRPQPLTVDTDTAAAMLGVPARTLGNWRQSGDGPPYLKLGSGGRTSPVRYRVEALEEWLRERERVSTSDYGAGQ